MCSLRLGCQLHYFNLTFDAKFLDTSNSLLKLTPLFICIIWLHLFSPTPLIGCTSSAQPHSLVAPLQPTPTLWLHLFSLTPLISCTSSAQPHSLVAPLQPNPTHWLHLFSPTPLIGCTSSAQPHSLVAPLQPNPTLWLHLFSPTPLIGCTSSAQPHLHPKTTTFFFLLQIIYAYP